MTRHTGQFGRLVVRSVVKASALLAVNAALATSATAQEAAPAQAPAGWMDQVEAFRKKLEWELGGCLSVSGPGAGVKVCEGTNGFSYGGKIGSMTLGKEGLPGTISPDGGGATIGYSHEFHHVTPEGNPIGGFAYNPVTGATKVTAGYGWGVESPASKMEAKLEIEGGVTYRPEGNRPSGSLTGPANVWQTEAALYAAREQQRIQAMTYQQKLDELTNLMNARYSNAPTNLLGYARQQSAPAATQYPASAPLAAQVLTAAQMAAQMNAAMPSRPAPQYQPAPSFPASTSGSGAYNPPSMPTSSGGSYQGTTTIVYNDSAPKVASTAPATGFTYNQNAPKIVGSATPTAPAPVVPNVAPRIPGTQSPTAALTFPGE